MSVVHRHHDGLLRASDDGLSVDLLELVAEEDDPTTIVHASTKAVEQKRRAAVTAAIKLYDYKQTQYIGTVELGTPVQRFKAIFDSGSANIWVYGIDSCVMSAKCDGRARYDHLKSKTYHKRFSTSTIRYGSGTIDCAIATE